jgi:prepilin-type N-terminal cleavage/methylation domain-containing protein
MSRKPAFTLIEVLVAVGIIAILMGILLPVLMSASRKSKEATCTMNMVEIAQAVSNYWESHEHAYPSIDNPMGELIREHALAKLKTCPLDPEDGHDSYGPLYNYWGYAPGGQPKPLKTRDEAAAVYGPLTTATDYYWRGAAAPNWGPDVHFPGLANGNPSGDTIVTTCPYHTGNGGRYIVLRRDGSTDFLAPPPNDPLFWTLSKPKP